jgi:hypothetical protein
LTDCVRIGHVLPNQDFRALHTTVLTVNQLGLWPDRPMHPAARLQGHADLNDRIRYNVRDALHLPSRVRRAVPQKRLLMNPKMNLKPDTLEQLKLQHTHAFS